MAPVSTSIALVFPVPSFAVTCPVPINPTVKAAARTRRRSSAHVFTIPGSSWTTWNPFGKLNNYAAPINVTTVKVVPCFISIMGIAKLNKCKLMLHIHISHFAEMVSRNSNTIKM
jgi:hypothetical protein